MAVAITGIKEFRSESEAPLQAWPLLMIIGLYPLWFLLGISGFMWVALAVPMTISLSQRRSLVAPKGFGFWVLFLIGVTGSALSLDSISRSFFFFLRFGWYLGATVFLLYLVNGGTGITVWRIIRMFTFFWMATVAGGYLAFVLGDFTFSSPMAYLLPQFLLDNDLIKTLVNPSFADNHDFLGFPVPRSKAPFAYTNSWGSMLALLTPFGLMALSDVRVGVPKRLIQLTLLASIVPAVTSLNRGLWLSLGVGVLYATFRSGTVGQRKIIGRLGLLGAFAAALYYFTPLGELIVARLSEGHSDKARSSLATEAVVRGLERPIFGWGSPRSFVPNLPPIGTHGQVWNLIFSYGIVGLVGWVGAMLTFFWKSRKPINQVGLWAHTVIVISLVQIFFYLQVPHQLFTVMAAVAIAIRAKEITSINKTEAKLVN